MTDNVTVPARLLTIEEWDALDETDFSRRFELVDGVVVVNPPPTVLHQLASRRLANALERQLPKDLLAVENVAVAIDLRSPPTVRVPDVVVVPLAKARLEPPRFDPAEVALVVEIVSPGSRRVDRVMKAAEYQEAGVQSYWIIDSRSSDANRFVAYELREGKYVEVARGRETVEVTHPVSMTVDVNSLLTWS